jgi:hypothetical protein
LCFAYSKEYCIENMKVKGFPIALVTEFLSKWKEKIELFDFAL